MTTLAELLRQNTAKDEAAAAHLQRLVAAAGMLSDLSFSDLLLLLRTDDAGGSFVVIGQSRPATAQTLHRSDLLGTRVSSQERVLAQRAYELGRIVDGEAPVEESKEIARVQCIPVSFKRKVVAVLSRESPSFSIRRTGELEQAYVSAFGRLARMVADGTFPFAVEDVPPEDLPRVGDGAIMLDSSLRVTYASPNAINALHRMGVHSNVEGLRLDEAGFEEVAVRAACSSQRPITEEIELRADVIVLLRCIPLLRQGQIDGALVLLRDVTDLRRRDRLLLSKDATIREVHHRVKNNLQTISSLLRLQARRLGEGPERTGLQEAERRIRSIAIVHEILSQEATQSVAFDEVLRPLLRMAEDSTFADTPVVYRVEGKAGVLGADVATPLAVALTEVLVNAAEHAFTAGEKPGEVSVTFSYDGDDLIVVVHDNGQGFPSDFDITTTSTLGLSIVRTLVDSQLRGSLEISNDDGATVQFRVPTTMAETTRL